MKVSEAYLEMIQDTDSKKQAKSTPLPSVKANVVFRTPAQYGQLLGNWSLSVNGSWYDAGYYTSRTRGFYSNIIEIRDSYYCNMKLMKPLKLGPVNLNLLMQIDNLFNLKRLSLSGQSYGFRLFAC